MPRAARPCCTPGCPELITSGSWCADCERAIEQRSDRRRGSSAARGYKSKGHRRFRRLVLTRDPLCVLCLRSGRTVVSTVADHWPVDRRELVARGMDPDDPSGGRGLCASCHGKETAVHQPGGWANR